MIMQGLLYTHDHEWAKIEGDTATIGITDYAQQMLGDITFVELPSTGKEVEQKDEIAVVESAKAANSIYAPVTGKITQVNSALESQPQLMNNDCYGAGWICKIEITDSKSASELMHTQEYSEYLKKLE